MSLDRRNFLGTAVLGGAVSVLFSHVAHAQAKKGAKKDTGYYVIAEIVAKPESVAKVRDLLIPYCKGSRKEPGCQIYTLMEVIAEPGRFLTFERWTNKAALDAHMVTPEIKAIVPKLEGTLAKPISQLFLNGLVGASPSGG